jgi:SAM-dependent methyltransferase
LWGTIALQPPLWFYPFVIGVIFIFYANTLTERVPLYLTNRTTWTALSQILDNSIAGVTFIGHPAFVDLGCGLGGALVYLAHAHPDWKFVGVETAPGPYLIAKLRTATLTNVEIRFQSLWKTDLAAFDVVYAFLSPAPMPRLHAKAAAQMRPGTVLISNSFWADAQPFDGIVEVNDARSTRLIFSKI